MFEHFHKSLGKVWYKILNRLENILRPAAELQTASIRTGPPWLVWGEWNQILQVGRDFTVFAVHDSPQTHSFLEFPSGFYRLNSELFHTFRCCRLRGCNPSQLLRLHAGLLVSFAWGSPMPLTTHLHSNLSGVPQRRGGVKGGLAEEVPL